MKTRLTVYHKTRNVLQLLLLPFAVLFFPACNHTETPDDPWSAVQSEEILTTNSAEDTFFQIAVLPDTQYYTALKHGGTMDMFREQIAWIRRNKSSSRIAYVVHLGDVVDHGSTGNDTEWLRASTELYKLEQDTIPYGIAVGNHDQSPIGNPSSPGTASGYGVYFGRDHMEQFPWYGGAQGSSNNSDNHYDIFTAGGQPFLVLYLEFNSPGHDLYSTNREATVMDWADGVIEDHPGHKVIVVSHSLLRRPSGSNSNIREGQGDNSVQSTFSNQGEVIYERMKHHSNVFLMLGGHVSGEGFRRDEYNGHVIKSYLSDYQSRRNPPYTENDRNGGNGLMRVMKIDLDNETLSVRTFAPRTGANILEEDEDSMFTEPLYQ